MSKFILRVRVWSMHKQPPMATLWLLKAHSGMVVSGRMHGDMTQQNAEPIIALMEAAGVKIQRDPVMEIDPDSEHPCGSAVEQIAATSQQGLKFDD